MEMTKKPVKPYPGELRERAVRMVREHASDEHASEWAAMRSIAEKVGCTPVTPLSMSVSRDLRGAVGSVVSIEASRLARNGREWQTLFCGLVGTLIADEDFYAEQQAIVRMPRVVDAEAR